MFFQRPYWVGVSNPWIFCFKRSLEFFLYLIEVPKLSLVVNDREFSFLNLTPITVVYFACWINCIAEMIWFCIEARQDLRSKSIRNCCKASVFRCYWKLNVIARKKYYIKKQCFHPWNSIFALLSTTKILLTCALVLYTNGRHYILHLLKKLYWKSVLESHLFSLKYALFLLYAAYSWMNCNEFPPVSLKKCNLSIQKRSTKL